MLPLFLLVAGSTNAIEQSQKIVGDGSDGLFGISLAFFGKLLVVGEPGEHEEIYPPGSASIYKQNGTTFDLIQKIRAPNGGEPLDDFGWSVAISQDVVVVGCPSAFKLLFQHRICR